MIQPPGWPRLRRGIRALLRKRDVEREMADEMRFHLEMEADDLRRAGLAPDEARRRAYVAFGGVERYKEEARAGHALRWLEDLGGDLRYAARSLRRTPAFTLVAVLALGLGIGANAVVFGYVDAAAFRPLPVERPGELVAIYTAQGEAYLLNASYPLYEDLQRGVTGLAGAAAFTEGPVSLSDGATADVAWAHHVTDNYFPLLGVRPAQGRLLRAGDARAPVVVLGHALWTDDPLRRRPGGGRPHDSAEREPVHGGGRHAAGIPRDQALLVRAGAVGARRNAHAGDPGERRAARGPEPRRLSGDRSAARRGGRGAGAGFRRCRRPTPGRGAPRRPRGAARPTLLQSDPDQSVARAAGADPGHRA